MEPIARIPGSVARERARRAARALASDARVRLVFLFGSATADDREEVRDVDVAVLARPAIPFDEWLRVRADVSKAAGGEVELIALDRAPVLLTHEVAESGRCLFAREPQDEVEFVTRARLRYWDFRPYLDGQSRMVAERQRERLDGPQA